MDRMEGIGVRPRKLMPMQAGLVCLGCDGGERSRSVVTGRGDGHYRGVSWLMDRSWFEGLTMSGSTGLG